MAIKNLFGRGVGFNGSVIGWVVTRGYGALSAGGGGSPSTSVGTTIPRPLIRPFLRPFLRALIGRRSDATR